MKKVIVTGAAGMLGTDLCPLLSENDFKIYRTDLYAESQDFDILDIREENRVNDYIKEIKPELVIHLAAETDVDSCEKETEHAFLTNTKGTENIAKVCRFLDIPMVFISTGAVFDGKKEGGYTEEDMPRPLSVYGNSKLKAERIVQSVLTKYYIVRAGWMIGGHKKDKKFVWKIIQILKTKKEISVVTDKFGSPTFTKDFSKGILDIVSTGQYGLYHCVNKGICNRFNIAEKIVECLGRKDIVLKPVTSEAFPLPAPRGRSESLLNHKLSLMGIDKMRPWQEALKEYIEEAKEVA